MKKKYLGMVDISAKTPTERIAKAQAFVKLGPGVLAKIKNNDTPKGDILETAKIAAILAAKKTDELIPLCHNIEIESVYVDLSFKKNGLLIQSIVKAMARTGVEMEALVAVSVAALTVYDMCKMFTKAIEITDIYLLEKRGGKSGIYRRQ